MAGRALRPLQQITATTRRVADRNLHERIALTGPKDEIKDLADTIDAMLERLDRAFDGQRRFVANASHELRTPLALNRTLIEVALEDPDAFEAVRHLGTTLLAVNRRHEQLIDGLLTLASSEQSIERPTSPGTSRQNDAETRTAPYRDSCRPAPGHRHRRPGPAGTAHPQPDRQRDPLQSARPGCDHHRHGHDRWPRPPHDLQYGTRRARVRDPRAVPALPAVAQHRTTRRHGHLPPPRSGPRPLHRRGGDPRPQRRCPRATRRRRRTRHPRRAPVDTDAIVSHDHQVRIRFVIDSGSTAAW